MRRTGCSVRYLTALAISWFRIKPVSYTHLYAAVMKLPEKQAKRVYARYYLGMTVNEIAEVEGVDPSRVRDSIRRGLK